MWCHCCWGLPSESHLLLEPCPRFSDPLGRTFLQPVPYLLGRQASWAVLSAAHWVMVIVVTCSLCTGLLCREPYLSVPLCCM